MSEAYMGDDKAHQHHGKEPMHSPEWELSDETTGSYAAQRNLHSAVLSSLNSTGRGNAPQRQASMLQVQKTHGNRAVQRYVPRSTVSHSSGGGVPVQRDDDDQPFIPKFTPFPYPTLDLPFGKGSGIAANPSELDLNLKLGGFSGKLGYEYEGNLTGEANLGDYWLKGGFGKKGFSLGLGHGNPLITPPGIPPMANDPSGDLRGGDLDPRTIGKSLDDLKDYQLKPGLSWGLQGGKDDQKGWYGWGGLQYNW